MMMMVIYDDGSDDEEDHDFANDYGGYGKCLRVLSILITWLSGCWLSNYIL